jgi:GntR family transcriptional regulator/MocR family aminotransferase
VSRSGARAIGAARDRGVHAGGSLYAPSSARKAALLAQRDALLKCLRPRAKDSVVGGLAVVLRLPDGAPDVSIAKETLTFGLAPTPLSLWYASRVSAQSGLLLGIATAPQKHLAASCDRLYAIIDRCT